MKTRISVKRLDRTLTTTTNTKTNPIMTSAAHELISFDGAGRGEGIRILLHAEGIKFTDTRVKGADWIP
jgi:hypothetical protein